MTRQVKVVVVGATGFVGRAVAAALVERGAVVTPLKAPRLPPVRAADVRDAIASHATWVDQVADSIRGADVVVNAAGVPDASSRDETGLISANSLLPAVLALAVRAADVPRFVHVSSAVVQGNAPVLDQSDSVRPFSAYSRSKALGETLIREISPENAVVYRPPSVHARDRRVSRMMARLARSSVSTVASPGSAPSPQALLENVADAIAFLALTTERPPPYVIQPSEGLTTSSVLALLGDREPRKVPRGLARALVTTLALGGRALPALAANARRIELLWFGQGQSSSWLTEAGWSPVAGQEAWRHLGHELAQSTSAGSSGGSGDAQADSVSGAD